MNYQKIKLRVDEVEKGHSAFLLNERVFDLEIKNAERKLAEFPLRLKNGVRLRITTWEPLPKHSYRANKINITVVVLRHIETNDWMLISVRRISVWKKANIKTTMSIPIANAEEIKNILLTNSFSTF